MVINMKKVAILTITNSGLNFGNRLQNFALQKYLEQFDVDVENIVSAKSCKNSLTLSKLRRLTKKLLRTDDRRKNFNEFNRKYIKNAKCIRYEGINESSFANKYDIFIAGSDQVWNPNFHFNSDFEFASFAPREKRCSYAASIGVSRIKSEYREEFIKNINGMRTLSVREKDSIPLIKELTGRDAMVHVDPTMLLDRNVYEQIEEKPPQGLPDKYMFVYFLGNVPKEYRDNINKLANNLGIEVVELSEMQGTKYYNIGPQHFLYALNHADYICTDSFHGSVFSILFEKKFSIFARQDNDECMNSRIETLVDTFGLNDRIAATMDIEEALKEIDYSRVKEILEKEREKSRIYLTDVCQG